MTNYDNFPQFSNKIKNKLSFLFLYFSPKNKTQ